MSDDRRDRRDEAERGLSRRGFLKGAGLTVAAVGAVGPAAVGGSRRRAGPREVEIVGPGPVNMTLTVNGEDVDVLVPPTTTLLDALRGEVGLTGSKRVCDRGSCGGCTMHLDGDAINACSLLAIDAVGREVTTIEGLAGADGELSPMQAAFVSCDALQCGFCTPGMVMACTALVSRDERPDRAAVAEGIAGNICRCGTYENVFEAVALATRGTTPEKKR